MNEQRFDELIRAALEWQAGRTAATQPSLRQATERLLPRLQPATAVLRPRVRVMPATVGGVNLLVLLGLLIALMATAVVVGALLLRQVLPTPVGPLGFAGQCEAPMARGITTDGVGGVALELEIGGRRTTLYQSRHFVRDLSVPGTSRASTVRGASYESRTMTPRGMELLLAKLDEAGLAPGCWHLQTQASTGRLEAMPGPDAIRVYWGPDVGEFSLARGLNSQAEGELAELAATLGHPESWLPDDAWEGDGVAGAPVRWLLITTTVPTGKQPGERFSLPNGVFVDGSDHRYEQVAMPPGTDLAAFGDELPLDDRTARGSRVRCGVVGRDDAVALADSLDRLTLGADIGDLFTEDLSADIAIHLRPALPHGFDCDSIVEETLAHEQPLPTEPAGSPAGDLAAIDPCSLFPSDADFLQQIGVENLVAEPSRLPLGVAARACGLFDTDGRMDETMGRHGYRRVTITLYPRSIGHEQAADLAAGTFGEGTEEQWVGGTSAWVNACLATDAPCVRAIATWSDHQLLLITFDSIRFTRGEEREITEAILDHVDH